MTDGQKDREGSQTDTGLHSPLESRKGERRQAPIAQELGEADRKRCDGLARRYARDRADEEDIDCVTRQLGRYPRGIVSVAARCSRCGTPLVVVTRPLITDHVKRPTPFPTMYYLTSPEAVKAVSRLEATGIMAELTARLAGADPAPAKDAGVPSSILRAVDEAGLEPSAYVRAHLLYLRVRHTLAGLLGDSEEHIAGISAGGMPSRVKCLHALVAQSLAMGPGANPVGDLALGLIRPDFSPDVCRCAVRKAATVQRKETR